MKITNINVLIKIISYLCMASNFPEEIAFGFLLDVKKEIFEIYDYHKIISSTSYLLDNFSRKIIL